MSEIGCTMSESEIGTGMSESHSQRVRVESSAVAEEGRAVA